MRLAEIRQAVAWGATEIDIVIQRNLALAGKWEELFEDIRRRNIIILKLKL
jgi:deoxyribose-phosphate aldolase